MKKLLSLILAAVMVTCSLAACGSKEPAKESVKETAGQPAEQEEVVAEQEEIVLSWMNHTSEEKTIAWQDAVIAEFEKTHPNIKIEVQRMGHDSYIQTRQAKFASGDAPDLYQLECTDLQTYVDNGYAASLSGLDLASKYDEGATGMLTAADGNVYAMPLSSSIMCVTYNKDVFEEAGITESPKTLDAFYEACEKIAATGKTPIGAGYGEVWCLMADVQADSDTSVLLKDPNAILDLEARRTKFVDSEAYRGVLERLKARQQYCNDDPFGNDWNTVCTGVANGEIAMVLNGNWAENNIIAMNPNANIGVFALPATNDPSDTLLPIQAGVEGMAVNPESKHLDAAMEFVDFFHSEVGAKLYAEMQSGICLLKGADAEGATGTKADILNLMNNGGARSMGNVDHGFQKEYIDAFLDVTAQFLLQDQSVDEALTALDTEFDRIASSN